MVMFIGRGRSRVVSPNGEAELAWRIR